MLLRTLNCTRWVSLLCFPVLESNPLQRFFFNRLRELCCAWLEEPPSQQPGTRRFLQTSAHAIRNTRRKMEDRHVAIAEFNQLCGLEVPSRAE